LHGYMLTRERLAALAAKLSRRSARERALIPGLNDERADVILPGALTLLYLMEHGGFESLVVSGAGVREGLFFEHFLRAATPPLTSADEPLLADVRAFSVLNLARLYNYEAQHCAHVQMLALSLFDQLAPLHSYGAWERQLLADAALLHDIGVSVAYYDHHKHSAYLVLNAALYGVSHREQVLIALLAYYHRKGEPDVAACSEALDVGDDVRAAQLGALLRIAEYLERSKGQRVRALRVSLEADTVRVHTEVNGDARVEIWDANRRTGLFRRVWGKAIEIV
jgi:exopolyphosphatase / guanosine-5'-triphosphate,3'-diphosphate pyrophosphatase